jgi:hypothetical protein
MEEQKLHPRIKQVVEFLNFAGIIPDICYGICTFKIGNDTIEFYTTDDDQDIAESFQEQYIRYRINNEYIKFITIQNFKDAVMMMLIKELKKEIKTLNGENDAEKN